MGRHYVGDVCAGIPLGLLTVAIVTQVKTAVAALGMLHSPNQRAAQLTASSGAGSLQP